MKDYTLKQYINNLLYEENRGDLIEAEPQLIYLFLKERLKERNQLLFSSQPIVNLVEQIKNKS